MALFKNGRKPPISFRNKIFIANTGLISLLLLGLALFVQHRILADVTAQTRQAIVGARPLYQLIWQQRTQVLANSCRNITQTDEIKRVLATRDPATIEDLVEEMLNPQLAKVDLLIISDKEGHIISSGQTKIDPQALINEPVDVQHTGFIAINNRLYQLITTPVMVQTGMNGSDVLAILTVGFEITPSMLSEIKQETSSEIAFLVNNTFYSSTLDGSAGKELAYATVEAARQPSTDQTFNLAIGEQQYVCFMEPLEGLNGKHLGSLVVLRSLSTATTFIYTIRKFLILLWLAGLSFALLVSYRIGSIERHNQIERAAEIQNKNKELESKNNALLQKNRALIESNQRADRIFSALAEALPGTVLDEKYRLDEKIGTGGFGAVYRATHLAMKRSIAVKVFKPIPGNDSAEGLQRFQLEAISACRVNHPNAITVLDSGISSEGIAYLVMELLEGHSLREELREKGPLSLTRAATILLPICDVISKAHATGIVHRDIKYLTWLFNV